MIERRGKLTRELEHVLERRATKVVLSILIVLSVLPLDLIENAFGPVLLVIFGTELVVRVAVHRRVLRREGGSPWGGRLLLVLDLVAILTFLPFPFLANVSLTHPLRLLRLIRLVLLLRYGAQIARDVWGIVTRRERLRHFLLVTFVVSILALLSAVVLVNLDARTDWNGDGRSSSDQNGDGRISASELVDVVWWCFRQLESGDNLVRSLHEHPLVIVISLLLTAGGLFILAFVIGIGASVLEQLVAAERQKPTGLRNHSVIVGPVHAAEPMVRELARLYAKNRWIAQAVPRGLKGLFSRRVRGPESRIALLGREEEPPQYIYDSELRTVMYRQGDPADPAALARVDVSTAKRVIVLAHPVDGEDADAVAVSSVMAVRELNSRARLYVELRGVGEVARVTASCGGERTYPLEISRLIGLFLCQHLVVPGVDRLYGELLTAEGSEIYTHVMNLSWEFEALADLPPAWGGPAIRWEDLLLGAYDRHHVVLLGAMLGSKNHSVSAEKLVLHLNPHAASFDPRAVKLGACAGRVPIKALRGLVGLSPTYAELQRASVDLSSGWVPEAAAAVGPVEDMPLGLDDGGLHRVLVIGENDALASMLGELAIFVRGTRVVVAMDGSEERGPRSRRVGRIHALGCSKSAEGVFDLVTDNAGSARCVFFEELDVRAIVAHPVVREGGPYDAVVVLSDPLATDPDARTSMRVLQLSSRIESQELPTSDCVHVLIEVSSPAKGALVLPRLERLKNRCRQGMRTTLVSTQVLKNYFMVHSAFVPGIPSVYDELLSERGQEFVRLRVARRWPSRPVSFRDLLRRLARHRLVPLGVELRDRSLVINAHPSDPPFDGGEVDAIFVIGDTAALGRDVELT
ncbi:MAG: hypothetical protein HYY06_24000 [Deltaproteobacteria bacterium]|nr:hypothetical protein [Deltaproteobacteria bacterium]